MVLPLPLHTAAPPAAGITILPVLSAATPRLSLPEAQARALIARIQDAGTEVVKVRLEALRRACCAQAASTAAL